jgi:hypothetical protein
LERVGLKVVAKCGQYEEMASSPPALSPWEEKELPSTSFNISLRLDESLRCQLRIVTNGTRKTFRLYRSLMGLGGKKEYIII